MANKHLKLGTTVKLSENSEWICKEEPIFRERNNPLDVTGSIGLPEHIGWVTVNWDNGEENFYQENAEDLIPIGESYV